MDAIQLALNVNLKRTIPSSQRFFFKQQELSEATYPLFISYLAWLRKIKATPNQFDVMYQNEQKNREFRFLCKRNLLFFLTVTGQFNVIEKLFKTPSFTTKFCHLITLIKKEHYKRRQKKSSLLNVTFLPKAKSHSRDQKHNLYFLPKMSLFNHDIKQTHQLSFVYTVRRLKIVYLVYINKIELLRKTLNTIQTNPNIHSHLKKNLLHQITMPHRSASKNKALFTAPINQNSQTSKTFKLILQAWKQLHDVLGMKSIFNLYKKLSLEKHHKDENTTSMKRVDELDNLVQGDYSLYDKVDLEKTHDVSAEARPLSKLAEEYEIRGDVEQTIGACTPSFEGSSAASTKQSATSLALGKRSNIKDSPFMNYHLTFFSPPQKNEQSMAFESHFNFCEQETANKIKAGY
ncbi:hypothetical protein [Legionella parisiensis]|nr:hypothetical protein [Legionella parisiensis]KTD40099.1 hypothetical protein Lpar_1416 [Legionella parisiensis]STX77357.1 Uncharacterised protein [Legionella parisiensis]